MKIAEEEGSGSNNSSSRRKRSDNEKLIFLFSMRSGFTSAPRWLAPSKAPLASAELLPVLDREVALLVAQRERQLRSTVNTLRAQLPRHQQRLVRPAIKPAPQPVAKRHRQRTGFVDALRVKGEERREKRCLVSSLT